MALEILRKKRTVAIMGVAGFALGGALIAGCNRSNEQDTSPERVAYGCEQAIQQDLEEQVSKLQKNDPNTAQDEAFISREAWATTNTPEHIGTLLVGCFNDNYPNDSQVVILNPKYVEQASQQILDEVLNTSGVSVSPSATQSATNS